LALRGQAAAQGYADKYAAAKEALDEMKVNLADYTTRWETARTVVKGARHP